MDQSITDAVAEAVAELKDTGQGAEAAQPPEEPTPVEGTEESTATPEEDVPTEYFKIPLGDLAPEVRREIIDSFKAKDSRITKLEQRIAEQRKAEDESPKPALDAETPYVPTDEEILSTVYSMTPDDPDYEFAKRFAVPVLRQNLDLMLNLGSLREKTEAQEALAIWNKGLDEMEAEHGVIPGLSRQDIIDFAIEEEIDDPEVAYLKLAFGAKEYLNAEATKARLEAAEELRERKKQAGSGVRPRTSAPTEAKDIPAGTSVAEAIKIAAAQAESELGVSWENAAKGFLPGHG